MPSSLRAPVTITVAAVLLVAVNLRIGQIQVAPVIEDIRHDTGMSSAVAGLLATIPVMCMGAFAFAGAPIIRRIGPTATIAWSLWLVAIGTAGRAFMDAPGLLALTVPIGVGVALIGVALPTALKAHFADRAASLTGMYVASLSAGAIFVAVGTVPMADLFGDWRWALAAGALFTIPAIPLWSHARAPIEQAEERPARMKGHRTQRYLLAIVFGLQAMTFGAMMNWIAAAYEDAGWTEHQASLATGSIPFMSIITALLVSRVTTPATRRYWALGTGIATAFGVTGIALAPTTWPVLWLLVGGLGIAMIFPLVMVLPLDLQSHPADVAELTGWMLGIGYMIGGPGPAIVGALRDATGGFEVPFLVMGAAGLASGVLVMAPALRPARRDDA